MGYHRGLRPGHVLKGVARKLGRSGCFLVRHGEVDTVRRGETLEEVRQLQPHRLEQKREAYKVPGADSHKRTIPGGAFGSLSGT